MPQRTVFGPGKACDQVLFAERASMGDSIGLAAAQGARPVKRFRQGGNAGQYSV